MCVFGRHPRARYHPPLSHLFPSLWIEIESHATCLASLKLVRIYANHLQVVFVCWDASCGGDAEVIHLAQIDCD